MRRHSRHRFRYRSISPSTLGESFLSRYQQIKWTVSGSPQMPPALGMADRWYTAPMAAKKKTRKKHTKRTAGKKVKPVKKALKAKPATKKAALKKARTKTKAGARKKAVGKTAR